MRTTWETLNLDDLQDAAASEARTGFDARGVPERDFVETLPYFSAFDEFRWHVTDCRDCLDDGRPDCSEGVRLRDVARVGLGEQHRLAASN